MSGSTKPTVLTAGGFTDRVMSAIALMPAPTPTRTFVAAARAGAVRDAVAALWVAWHLGTVRSWHVAPRVRARSFALVLAVASVLATGGLAAAAAVHSVVPQRDDRNPVSAPSGSSVDEGPVGNGQSASDGPAETEQTDESPSPSHEPAATDHGGSGPTVDSPDDAEDGQHTTRGAQPDEADDHEGDHHDGDAAEDHHGDEPDEDGDDGPAATDDHGGSDGGDEPDESDDPDHASDGGDEPDSSNDDSGATGGDHEPDDSSGAEPDSD